MKRIWSVIHEKNGRRVLFGSYAIAIQSVNLSFPGNWKFPTESQVTDNSRIGFAPSKGDWVQIDAVQLNESVVQI